MEENNLEPARKKGKLDNEVKTPISSTTIDALPNEMLIEIFKYLSVQDRVTVQRVCSRWYQTVRSEILWKDVQLFEISPDFFIELLVSLPPCVSHLRLKCSDRVPFIPISLLNIMAKLHENCPLLKTLMLENMHLAKNRCIGETSDTLQQVIESEFCEENNISPKNCVLQELKVLSLKRLILNHQHFNYISARVLPNIAVLDLSFTRINTNLAGDELSNGMLSTLIDLEELYIQSCEASRHIQTFLKNVKKLRVLDLASNFICSDMISALKQNCGSLEKLCLSYCDNMINIRKTDKDQEFFPNLQSLCFTHIKEESSKDFFTKCPLLKLVNLCRVKNQYVTFDFSRYSISMSLNKRISCNHFVESKYYCFDPSHY